MASNDNKHDRREPTLGDLDRLDKPQPTDSPVRVAADDRVGRPVRASRHSRAPAHRAPSVWHSWLWPALAVLIAVVVALAWLNQDRLRALLPRTHVNALLVKADAALTAGKLEGPDGAHQLYAQVLQDQPDNTHALNGVRKVGEAELARATSAIKAGDFAGAQENIANAKRLLGGGTQVDATAAALAKAEHPAKRLDNMIAKAQQAWAAGQVSGKQGAAALYHEVLAVDPDNLVARHGLDRAGDALAAQARKAMQDGDVDTAAATVDELARLLPRDGDLPTLRAGLAQARQAVAQAVATHLAQGQADLHQGKFTGNGNDNALAEFQQVLKLDAGNQQAQAGLRQVARALVLRANAALDTGDAAMARGLIAQAEKLDPKSAELAVARARLPEPPVAAASSAGTASSAASSASTGLPMVQLAAPGDLAHPALTPLQKVEVKQLLQRAASAARSGHVLLPPGDSAYDLYSEVLTIDGNNAAALAGLSALRKQTEQDFARDLAAHRLKAAGGQVTALQSLEPGDAKVAALEKQLADAWLKHARDLLDEGNHQAAQQALQEAAQWHPDPARVKALQEALRNG
ncbi:MAG TPA: hypothetical protein VF271_00580 [Rhodanobacteraceae bacterium]